jgi:hypothetical protein
MNQGDLCLCGHTREVHFGSECSRVGCPCKEFALVDAAVEIFEALKELTSAVEDGIRRSLAHDENAILSDMISATLGQAQRVMLKAKGR